MRRLERFRVCCVAAFVMIAAVLAYGQCERLVGQWKCRVCGWLNPINARYCRRDRADLEEQRRQFRESLTPVFNAEPTRVARGSSVLLRWYTRCASRVWIEPGLGDLSGVGSIRVRPAANSAYVLHVESAWSDWMEQPPAANIEVFPITPKLIAYGSAGHIWQGDSVELIWESRNASRVTLNPGAQNIPATGSVVLSPKDSTTYYFTAESEGSVPVIVKVPIQVLTKPEPLAEPVAFDQRLFTSATPIVYFQNKEPRIDRQGAQVPFSEQPKLSSFAVFLVAHPDVHLSLIAYGFEFWDGRKGDYQRHRALLSKRAEAVRDFLISHGVRSDQFQADTSELRSVPKSAITDKESELKARRVEFEYRGVPPHISVRIYPETIVDGESAYLLWASSNAEQVVLSPGGITLGAKGMMRLDGKSRDFVVQAGNRFGFSDSRKISLQVAPAGLIPVLEARDLAGEFQDHAAPILFDRGESRLTPVGRIALNELASWLVAASQQQVPIVVRGFIGPGETRGLARRRAEEVVRFLVAGGVAGGRLRVIAEPSAADFAISGQLSSAATASFQRRVELAYGGSGLPVRQPQRPRSQPRQR
jgi:outer membrane protein OmpA-like peptidoglycan-associated protein